MPGPQPYQLLPPMTADERTELRRSMEEHGYDPGFPVVVDENGHILDGHHRVEIATELGLAYPSVVREGLSEPEKRIYAVSRNSARRHLTDAQRILAGKKIEPDYAALAARRQIDLAGSRTADLPENLPEGRTGETRDLVAAAVGLGTGKTYEAGKKTIAAVEELAKAGSVDAALPAKLANGEATLKDARKQVTNARQKEKKAEAAQQIQSALDGTEGTDAALRHRRANLLRTLSETMQPLYDRTFRIRVETVAELVDAEVRSRIDGYFQDFCRWHDGLAPALSPPLRLMLFPDSETKEEELDATRHA